MKKKSRQKMPHFFIAHLARENNHLAVKNHGKKRERKGAKSFDSVEDELLAKIVRVIMGRPSNFHLNTL